jgi:hypothetical protein
MPTEKFPDKRKQLSSPFSSGGGGVNFENQVQTLFVVLMLTGGAIPCLPPWPIKKIKLQGRNADYNTDDFITTTEEQSSGRQSKLLAQIKHSVRFTDNDVTFGEVIQAAWLDFKNSKLFDPSIDAIALICGPLSAEDIDVRTILEWASHCETANEFVQNVNLAKFSSDAKRSKLKAFRAQLKKANGGVDISDDELWRFLRIFHVLGYDMDVSSGVTLSLLHSHIAQFSNNNASGLWGLVSKEVASFNQNAGTVTVDALSEQIRIAFTQRVRKELIPDEFVQKPNADALLTTKNYAEGDQANALAFASLLGEWNEKLEGDREVIRKLIEGND